MHDWPKAIETVQKLQALLNESVPALIHYHCELAEQALQTKPVNLDEAIKQLDKAENALQKNQPKDQTEASMARIAMLRAEIAAQQGQPQNQRLQLESILSDAPTYSSLVADKLLQNYQNANELEQGLAVLSQHFEQHFSLDLFVILLKYYRLKRDDEAARRFAAQALKNNPTLLGLDKFLESEINLDAPKTQVSTSALD